MKNSYTLRVACTLMLLQLIILFGVNNSALAQLSGTKNIPGDYGTLAAAINDLNAVGVGAGGVTLNLVAGNPETAPAGGYVIGGTGSAILSGGAASSASNQVVITGNANIITASGSLTVANLNDAIFKLIGADYITIQGFTMQENGGNTLTTAASNNMTEWGVALLYVTATDGSQNNTIQNNTISLNRTYQNTFGIYSNSTHTATSVTTSATATGTAGGNSGLKIYGNNISNVNNGILVVGPTAAADNNNGIDIGGISGSTSNTISNYGTTNVFSSYANVSGTLYGILVRNSTTINISYNSITSSNGGATAGTLRAIYVPSFSNAPTGTYTNSINNNTISLTHGVSTTLQGITVESTTSTATSTLNINNNNFTAFTCSVASSGTFTVISNAMGTLTTNINGNQFTNITTNTTGSFTFISNNVTRPASGVCNVNSNSIVTAFNKTGAGGTVTFYNSNSTSPTTVSETNSGNSFSNITVTGATTIAGWVSTDGSTSAPFGPGKTVTNNTFSNITGGSSSIVLLTVAYSNSGLSTNNVSGNIVSTVSGSSSIIGISSQTASQNFFNNTISGLSSTGASAVTGLAITGGTIQNIFKNKIYDLQSNNASGTTFGITLSGSTTSMINNVYNNLIGDLRAIASTSTSDAIRGINITSTSTTGSINVYYNSIYINATSSGANFNTSGIFHTTSTTATTATLNLRNNIIVNTSTPAGTGLTVAYRRSSGAAGALANYGSTSNNNLFYAGTPGASRLIYSDGTSTAQTITAYKGGVFTAGTIAPRDAASISENPTWVSTSGSSANFLHISTGTSTSIESGAVNISGITDDFDGNTRQGNGGYSGTGSAPDIGADEFEGIPGCLPVSVSVSPTAVTICNGSSSALTASVHTLRTVTVQNTVFTPASMLVNVGDTIKWVWINGVHTTTSTSVPGGAATWDASITSGSQTFKYVVTVAGTYNYWCTIHGNAMTATFTASAPSYTWAPATGLNTTTGATVTASPTSTTTYAVIATDPNGCTGAASSVVTVNPTPTGVTATASSNNICSTASVNLFSTPGTVSGTNFSQNFDGVTAPALPSGWTASNIIDPDAILWVTTASTPNSAPNALFINDPASVSDKVLETPTIAITSSPATLTFSHKYGFEFTGSTFYDGGVLEISINGGAYQDIISAGGSFVANGYNGTLSTGFSNPIGGRSAWGSTQASYITVTVTLPGAAVGQNIKLRWRMGSDSSTGSTGWFVDDVLVTSASSSYTYSWTSDPAGFTSGTQNPTNVTPGVTTTYSVSVSNGSCSASASTTVNVTSATTFYADADNDTYGDAAVTTLACTAPSGYVANNTDCNDANGAVNPGAAEVCNTIDDDCDAMIDDNDPSITGQPTWYADTDLDTYGDPANSTLACSAPSGYVSDNTDCNDGDAAVNPGAAEVCNTLDDDCDNQIDEGVQSIFYADTDLDTYGDPANSTFACSAPSGYVSDNTDCNDGDAAVNPGATEVCNTIDDDCDTQIDEGVQSIFYADTDNDTYGDATSTTLACSVPSGYVSDNTDCNDNNENIHPGATEVCNFADDDCDGTADEGITYLTYYNDADGDGYGAGVGSSYCTDPGAGFSTTNDDCNDFAFGINPGATELCNNIDDNCDGTTDEGCTTFTYYADTDNDTYGDLNNTLVTSENTPPAGYVTNSTDCNDSNGAVFPGATEVCNTIDDDCDTQIDEGVQSVFYADSDNDNYGNAAVTTLACSAPAGYVSDNTDCNDGDVNVNPGATEVCNTIDDDCDTQIDEGVQTIFYADTDLDTYGNPTNTTLACSAPSGYVSDNTDCNDGNSSIHPNQSDMCNGVDDDCDGSTDEDATFSTYYADSDNDTYGNPSSTTSACSQPSGYVTDNTDCNDGNSSIHPNQSDVCNSVDDDCDGSTDEDATYSTWYADSDNDTYGNPNSTTSACSQPSGYVSDNTDCNDSNGAIHPGANEICNGIDDDCDGNIDNVASPVASFTSSCNLLYPGNTSLLTSTSTAGSGSIASYQWNLNGSPISGATNSTYTTGANANGDYTLTVTNSNSCSNTSSITTINNLTGVLAGGSYTIPSTCGFSTINNAVTYISTNGISGSVVFNVTGGHTETAPAGGVVLNQCALASGLRSGSSQTITFQKSGGGANPKINAYTGTSTTVDGIVKIVGTDYVTFDAIDVAEVSGNTTPTLQMEWGYALLKCDGNDGSNNNTIKNCVVTLNKANTISVGIYSGNHGPTSTSGFSYTGGTGNEQISMNGRNVLFGNTISNVYTGVSLNGNSAANGNVSLNDTLNEIGKIGQAVNSITNFGGSTTAVNAVIETNQRGLKINNNSINGGTGTSSTATVIGISMNSGVWGEIRNNTITLASSGTGAMTGITCGFTGGSTTNPNLVKITGNIVQNVNWTTGTTGIFTGITFTGGGTGSVDSISNNSVINNTYAVTAVGNTGAFVGVASTSSAAAITMSGNTVSGNTLTPFGTPTAARQLNAVISTGTPTLLNLNNNTVNNNTNNGVGQISGVTSSGAATTANINNNTVSNNTVVGGAVASSVFGVNCLGVTYVANNNTVINSRVTTMTSTIVGTVIGININSTSVLSATLTNNTIRKLFIGGTSTGTQVLRGISDGAATTTSKTISGNQVDSLYTSSTIPNAAFVGMFSSTGGTVLINKNRFYNFIQNGNGTTGTIIGIQCAAGNAVGIYNNYIGDLKAPASTNSTAAISGFTLSSTTTGFGVGFYYNTIRLSGSGGTTFGTSGVSVTSTSSPFEMRNNIIDNLCTPGTTSGFTVAYRRSGTGFTNYANTSNTNLFYAGTPAANALIHYDGTNSYQTLSAYKTAAATRDQQSVSENVSFVSTSPGASTYLHVDPAIATQAESGAVNVTGITDDYDGDVRQGNGGYSGTGTAPDIGADEFNGTVSDLTAPIISYTIMSSGCIGDRTLSATITDATGVPTSGSLVPRIYYKKNSGSYFSQPGTLSSGSGSNGTWAFTIVSSDFGGASTGDVISYFLIAQDGVGTPNISSNPGGVVATDVNTVTTPPSSPPTFSIITSNVVATATATPSAICNGATSQLQSTTVAPASTPTAPLTAYSISNLTGQTYSTLSGGGITIVNTTAQLTPGMGSTSQDDGGVVINLPFVFNYCGSSYNQMSMCTNGWVGVGNWGSIDAVTMRASGNLFTSTIPNNTIAAWFKDMGANFPTGSGSMRHGIIGTDVYAFQWDNANGSSFGDGATILISFQVNIYGPASSNPGRIEIIYGPTVGAITFAASEGIEDATGGTNHYINALDGTATSTTTSTVWPGNGNGYRFTPIPQPLAGANYAWSPASDVVSSNSQNTNTVALFATTSYTVSVTNPTTGCSATATTTVSVGDPLTASVNSPTICNGQSTSLTATPSGGGAPFTYTWAPSTGLNTTTGQTVSASPTSTTTYTVTVLDNCGSNTTANSTVTVIAPPTLTITPGSGLICGSGSVNLTASGSSATYTWAPATGLNTTTGASVNASPTGTTTYTVTASNGTCTSTATVVVTYSAAVTNATASASSNTVCSGSPFNLFSGPSSSSAIALSENFNGVTAPALPAGWVATNVSGPAPLWVTTTNTPNSAPNAAFIDDPVGVTDKQLESPSIFIAASPATVTFMNKFTLESGFDGGVLEISIDGGAYQDIISAGGSFVVGGYTGTISTTFSSPIAGRSAWTGTSTTYVTTTVNLPAAAIGHNIKLRWRMGSDTSISGTGWWVDDVQVTQPSQTNTFSWTSSPSGFTSTDQNPVGVVVSETTTFNVTITNNSGCSATASTTVSVGDPLSVSVNSPTICSGQSSSLTATPTGGGTPYTYMWAPSTGLNTTTGQTVSANPTSTTTYTVTVLDNCGSNATANSTVTVLPSPTVTVTPTSGLICGSGSVNLVASGSSASYTWAPAAGLNTTTGASVTASPTGTTTYIVTASDGTCTSTATAVVTYSAAVTNTTASASYSAVCSGNTVDLFSGPSSSTAIALAQNFDGVTAPALPSGWVATNVSGPAPLWVTTTNTPNSAPNAAFIDDPVGVTDKQLESPSIFIAASPATVTFMNKFTLESGFDGGVLEISIDGGAYQDIISAGGSFVVGGYTGTISTTFSSPIAGRSAWTGTSTTYITTTVNLPAAAIGHNIKLRWRMGSDTSISGTGWWVDDVQVTQPSQTNTFSWTSSPSGFTSTDQNPVGVVVSETTTYSVTITNSSGCTGTASTTVSVGLSLTASVNSPTICNGQTTTLTATPAGGGAPYTYTWAPATGLNTTTGQTVSANPTETMTYTVTVNDNCGSNTTATGIVTVIAVPVITVTPSSGTICGTGNVSLTASGASTYTWSPSTGLNATTGASVAASPTATTTYTVSGSNGSCTSTATVTISVFLPLSVTATATPTAVCPGGNSQLLATATQPSSGVTNYSFTALSGTFTPLAGGITVPAIQADDVASGLLPLGFNFSYAGAAYSQVYASSNGILTFGAANSSLTNNLNTGAGRPIIAPLWDDQDGIAGVASYITTGGSGNHVFTFEWLHWEWYYNITTGYSISYQVKLYEATGEIEFIYQQEAGPLGGVSESASIGLGGSSSGNFLSLNNSSASPTASSITETTAINAKPATGQIYRFTPPAATGITYSWSPATYLNDTTLSNPVASGVIESTVYTVTASNTNGCTATNTTSVTVADTTFFGLNSDYCDGDGAVLLTPVTPGGTFSGTGVIAFQGDYYFDPATSGIGTFVITYSLPYGCGSSQTTTVHAIPTVTLDPFAPACTNDPPFILTGGSPAGGQYFDQFGYVTGGDTFDPGAAGPGTHTIFYSYADQFGCASFQQADITVNNPTLTVYADSDNDGYGAGDPILVCVQPAGTSTNNTDCNDNDAAVNPGVTEICANGIDDNCDGQVDENCAVYTYYADVDGDLFGDPASSITSNSNVAPSGYVSDNTDCNDNDATVHTPQQYFVDVDQDGYGSTATAMVCSSTAPTGYSTNNTDCNDNNASVNPGATDICNGIDDNCDGTLDENPLVATITPGGTVTYCRTVPVTLTANSGAGITYQWYKGSTIQAGETNSTFTTTKRGSFKVVESTGVCNSTSAYTTVARLAIPQASITVYGNLDICATGSVLLRANNAGSNNSDHTYQWNKGGLPIIGATDRPYTATSTGDYTITVTNDNGCSTTSSIVTVTSSCKETQPALFTAELNVYPNPNNGQFVVELKFGDEVNAEADVQIMNALGQNIYLNRTAIVNGELFDEVKFDSTIPAGNYFVRVITDDKVYTGKIVYQK